MSGVEGRDQVELVRYNVESVHQIHGGECLCGFSSHVARDRTGHIVSMVGVELEKLEIRNP